MPKSFIKIGIIRIIIYDKDNTKGVKRMFEIKRLIIRPYAPQDVKDG